MEGRDIAETLEKYPPSEICDEWYSCVDDCDMHAKDMHCEDCDMYWGIVKMMEREMKNEKSNTVC